MINLPDKALVAEALNGNDDAFRVIVERYQKPVFNMAFRMCGDYDEAADLTQEAFLQVYRVLDKYDDSKKFFSWMYRVSHNICVNRNVAVSNCEVVKTCKPHTVTGEVQAAVFNSKVKLRLYTFHISGARHR